MTSEDAAIACGVGVGRVAVFRERGGISLIELTPSSGRYVSFAEREEIALLRVKGAEVHQIARVLGRSPSTISRKLRATGTGLTPAG